ncbi:EF hand domain-containing protein [Herbihabitans rhizosphaerae]|uniref:EF hand domain-containing protein n=1 Tax=Herbihabitans rhizosphaerae TaxID=1872711 RepID=A0A4Q7L2Y2_9PSEU|nr:EF-hand domain-containing protein [Herbihabitans rhizosphaerae]RZS43524.1 EF hand domain-containing protein [Herbihabitans rhizosphaerae]
MSANNDIASAFEELDLDRDGQITQDEFHTAMTDRGEEITDDEISSIFADADTDKDGKISLSEFTDAWTRAEQA